VLTELTVQTGSKSELIDITPLVQEVVDASGADSGICYLFVPHTTAGLTLNENWDPAVRDDALRALDRLVPRGGVYHHAEGNSPAHIKAMLLGFSAAVPFESGHLLLGTWQGIYLAEFDGPRRRRILVKILPD